MVKKSDSINGKSNLGLEESCCEFSETKRKNVVIEYLYLDLDTCDRCVGTDQVLEEVIRILKPIFEVVGYTIEYNKKEMTTINEAIENRFLSSPTIRVNGKDICDSIIETDCGCCGDISGTQVDCRVFEFKGRQYEVAPKELLMSSIVKAVFETKGNNDDIEYEIPDNLKRFYEGKEHKKVVR